MKVSSSSPIQFVFRDDSGYQNASCAIAVYADMEVKFGFNCHINPSEQWQKVIAAFGMPLRLIVTPPGGVLEINLADSTYALGSNWSNYIALILTAKSWEWSGICASLVGGMSGVGDWVLPDSTEIRVEEGSFLPSDRTRPNLADYRAMLEKFRVAQEKKMGWDLVNSAYQHLNQEQINEFWRAKLLCH